MADVSRTAESFPEAIRAALILLRDEIGASSAVLFSRKTPDQPYRCTASTLDEEPGNITLPADSLLMKRLRTYSLALPISTDDF